MPRHGDENLHESVQRVLDSAVRPLLNVHGGDVDIHSIDEEGEVVLRFFGACERCNLRDWTIALNAGPRVLAVEGVSEVRFDGIDLSRNVKSRMEQFARTYRREPGSAENLN